MAKEKIIVLQIGEENWKDTYSFPDNIEWLYIAKDALVSFLEQYASERKKLHRNINVVLLTDTTYDDSIIALQKYIEPYSTLYTTAIGPDSVSDVVRTFLIQQMAYPVNMEKPAELVELISHTFFSKQYGDKFKTEHLLISKFFTGSVRYDGSAYVDLEGDFGEQFSQIANYVYNIPKDEKPLEFWPEFIKSDTCSLEYHIQMIHLVSNDVISEVIVSERELTKPYYLRNNLEGYLHISIFAKGSGYLKLGPTHYRFSHFQFGKLLLGGEITADSNRQEIFHYFHPGDFTPPLNVYFSGYRTAEGFEGYWMMKSLNKPFLLLADPRLEGGSFYIGSEEYEDNVRRIIQDSLDFLKFDHSQMTMAGLSMGTYGALYYGIDFAPHAIVVGKPLVNLGTMAFNERIIRPGVFETSLDLLKQFTSEYSTNYEQELNSRFWDKLVKSDWSKTQLRIAYMRNDDYDRTAFIDLLKETRKKGVKLIGKGWVGRHNDNSGAITQWFINQYKHIIETDFSEDKHEN